MHGWFEKSLKPLKQREFADFPINIGLSLPPAAFTKNAHATLSLDCLPPLHCFAVIPFFGLLVVTFLIEILIVMPFLFVELMLLILLLPRFYVVISRLVSTVSVIFVAPVLSTLLVRVLPFCLFFFVTVIDIGRLKHFWIPFVSFVDILPSLYYDHSAL